MIVENECLRQMCNDTVKTYNKDSVAYTTETLQCVYYRL